MIELGELICAPYCTRMLGDLGADVIKVEPPEGDIARRYGPFPDDAPDPDRSGLFQYLNWNKRGMSLALESEREREQLEALLRDADVLVESLPLRRAEQWGLDFERLHRLNPRLVVTSITTYGRTGPNAAATGADIQVAAGASLAHRLGDADREPLVAPYGEIDFRSGAFGAAATLLALRARDASGEGQHVDLSTLEFHATVVAGNALRVVLSGADAEPTRSGNRRGSAYYPWTVLPCADGFVEIVGPREEDWQCVLRWMGYPDWAKDERFADRQSRWVHAGEIEPHLVEWLAGRTRDELWRLFQEDELAFQPVLEIDEVLASEQLRVREHLVTLDDGAGGSYRCPGAPYQCSEAGWSVRRPAPRLGEHNAEILAGSHAREELGSSRAGGADGGRAAPVPARSGDRGHGSAAPLAGVRVLDLGQVWVGPLVGQLLGDMGAEVVDVSSLHGWSLGSAAPVGHHAYMNYGRNKRGLGLNLKHPSGRRVLGELVQVSDVLIENYAPQTAEALGVSYSKLREKNERLIMVSLSATGQYGPWRELLTFGPSLTALYGTKSVLGYAGDGRLQEDTAEADPTAATYALVAILAALRQRERSGRGQYVDLAQGETLLAGMAEAVLDYEMNGRVARPRGNWHPVMVPYGCYPCRDGDSWVSIAVQDDAQWLGLCAAMGRADLAADSRFADIASRRGHAQELEREIAGWTRERTKEQAARLLTQHDVPGFPVLTPREVLSNSHLKARRREVRIEGQAAGELAPEQVYYGIPFKLRATPGSIRLPDPELGQHTDELLDQWLGMDSASIRRLRAEGALT